MPPRPYRIQLTSDIIADDVLVGEAIDQILVAEPGLNRIHRQIARRQRALRAVVTDQQWRLYMVIEELFNDRWSRALDIVAKAFFAAGQRDRRWRK